MPQRLWVEARVSLLPQLRHGQYTHDLLFAASLKA
jgi:hypothetical protein